MAKFTQEGKGKWCKIITPCRVSAIPKRDVAESDDNDICYEKAQWDTGSMVTLISQRVVDELRLESTGFTFLSGLENHSIKARTYIVNIKLPNNVKLDFIEVAEAPLPFVDLLIGMDVIADGDFHYSNNDGKSVFSFETL